MSSPWSVLILLVFVDVCFGHSRFVCPRPESSSSGIKSGPCSSEGNEFEAEYIDLTPGPFTIRWEETVIHTSAETRVSLNEHGNEADSCLLLDHVPHNEDGRFDFGPDCTIYEYPLGFCDAPSYITINIPDITCERCFLQIVSVMTDKYTPEDGMPCVQESIARNNCSSYFSCANVRIRPTTAGQDQDITSCLNYDDHLQGEWPYHPNRDPVNFAIAHYYGNGYDFTSEGWLQESDFIGEDATYPFALQPHGQCIPPTRYFGATPSSAPQEGHVGVLTVTITENRGWIRAAFDTNRLLGQITTITISDSNNEIPPFDVPVRLLSDNLLEAVLDMSEQTAYLEENGRFLDTLVIDTDQSSYTGVLEEGLVSSLTDGREYRGAGVMYIRDYGDLEWAMAGNIAEDITEARIRGPARSPLAGESLLTIDQNIENNNGFFAAGSFPDVSVDVLDALWKGFSYFNLQTASTEDADRGINGQISAPGDHYCAVDSNTCHHCEISLNDQGTPRGEPVLNSNGVATFDLENSDFHYRITMRDLQAGEVVRSAMIHLEGGVNYNLPAEDFQTSPIEDKSQILAGTLVDVSPEFLAALEQGVLWLEISTSRYDTDLHLANVPAISSPAK